MKTRITVALVAINLSAAVAGALGCSGSQAPDPAGTPKPGPESTPKPELLANAALPPASIPITVSALVPSDLNLPDGAPKATMQQAAAFAWQEFIALSWPAVKQTGGVVNKVQVNQRDTPDSGCKLGDPRCATQPLVWETFRGKVEIFPANGTPPGYPSVAPGDKSFGYDALPAYNYQSAVPPCAGQPAPAVPAFVNLDETDQITLDSMFAGIAPSMVNGNASPQIIRFVAKANRIEYTYVTSQGAGPLASWWQGPPRQVVANTMMYLAKNQASPPAGSSTLVSLPNGTIEIKAGWRVLTAAELSSGRFKTATVRRYENPDNTCYFEDTFGLVALHIIQKTPTAPYFIYATFEQADNLQTAASGPVEDVDGTIIRPPLPPCTTPGQKNCSTPTTPAVTLNDTATVSTTLIPPQITLVPTSASYCTTPGNEIYYLNTAGKPALPTGGFICVNYRDNPIPQPVIAANQTAHAAIKAYNQAQGIPDSPWMYYKLVNVQYQPIDKDYAGVYTTNDPGSGHNPASYHLSNIMVETDRTLQLFSGGLLGTGSNSDYDSQFTDAGAGTAIHRNMYYGNAQYNMGGCMGCHGSQGQHQGGDFSVILARGQVLSPEAPAPVAPNGAAKVRRNRTLK